MKWIKKLFVPSGQMQELTAYESWCVRWESRFDEYSGCTQKEIEIFTNEEDAKQFATELRKSFKLIRHTSGTNVVVRRN